MGGGVPPRSKAVPRRPCRLGAGHRGRQGLTSVARCIGAWRRRLKEQRPGRARALLEARVAGAGRGCGRGGLAAAVRRGDATEAEEGGDAGRRGEGDVIDEEVGDLAVGAEDLAGELDGVGAAVGEGADVDGDLGVAEERRVGTGGRPERVAIDQHFEIVVASPEATGSSKSNTRVLKPTGKVADWLTEPASKAAMPPNQAQ